MHYSVQPRHLHYTDVMLLLCDVLFGLGLGLGLGLVLPVTVLVLVLNY